MRTALGYAALSCAVCQVYAKALRWSNNGPRWIPARETPVFQPMLGNGIEPPAPTPAPHVKARDGLHARDPTQNTCAYIGGIQSSSLYCAATAVCVRNSVNSHIGCCDDTATFCPVWTTCFDSAQRSSFTTDNGFTLWCGNSSYPNCLTHLYYDATFIGYTLLGCGVAAGTDKVWYTPLTSSSSSSLSTTSPSLTSSASSISSSSSSSSSSSPTNPPTPTPTPDNGGSSTPIGPIVGGVVGGLAAIGLIILGVWALMRQNSKQKRAADAAAAGGAPGAPGAAPYQPPGPQNPNMAQNAYYAGAPAGVAGFNPLDPRSSVAKPPVAYSTTGSTVYTGADGHASPPHSPAPAYQGTPSPPPQSGQFGQYPQQQQGYEQHQHQQQPGVGYQQAPVQPVQPQQYSAELPTQRGDGQLTELQG